MNIDSLQEALDYIQTNFNERLVWYRSRDVIKHNRNTVVLPANF